MSVAFLVLNLLLMPFAYIKNCLMKFALVRSRAISCTSCLVYILLGPFLLLASQFSDLVAFLKVSCHRRKIHTGYELNCVSQADFELYSRMLRHVHQSSKENDEPVRARELIKELQVVLGIRKHVKSLIYGSTAISANEKE